MNLTTVFAQHIVVTVNKVSPRWLGNDMPRPVSANSGGRTAGQWLDFQHCGELLLFCRNHSPKVHCFELEARERQTYRQSDRRITALIDVTYVRGHNKDNANTHDEREGVCVKGRTTDMNY